MIALHLRLYCGTRKWIALMAPLSFLSSCGRVPSDGAALQSTETSITRNALEATFEKITFDQWCSRWKLDCSKTKKSPVSYFENSREAKQWRAIAELVEKFLRSGSEFTLEDNDWTSAKARLVFTQIGLQEPYLEVLDVLSRTGIQRVSIDPQGEIHFEARPRSTGSAGSLRGRSGLLWAFAPQGVFSVDVTQGAAGSYLFNGLTFSAAKSNESDSLSSLAFNDVDKALWSGDRLAVTHIPDGFLIRDVPVQWEKFGEFKREPLIRSVSDIRNIVFSQGRTLKLDQEFFSTAARQLPIFVEDQKILPALAKLTDSLGSLEIKAAAEKSALAVGKLERASSVMCRIEMTGTPALELTLNQNFGIQNVFTNEKMNAQIDLYGIQVKAKAGIPISFQLKRVDVEPTRVVIKGVPVIGEVAIPLPEEGGSKNNDKKLKKFECTERI